MEIKIMKKKYILLLIILLTISLIYYINQKIYKGDRLPITTERGIVWVNDFTKNSIYSDDQVTMITNNQNYDLYFDKNDQSFNIRLLEPEIEKSKPIAENGLLEILKISKTDVCKLIILISVPPQIDAKLSEEKLSLSYCKDKATNKGLAGLIDTFSSNPLIIAISIFVSISIIVFLIVKYTFKKPN
jgi:hypothetical protein